MHEHRNRPGVFSLLGTGLCEERQQHCGKAILNLLILVSQNWGPVVSFTLLVQATYCTAFCFDVDICASANVTDFCFDVDIGTCTDFNVKAKSGFDVQVTEPERRNGGPLWTFSRTGAKFNKHLSCHRNKKRKDIDKI